MRLLIHVGARAQRGLDDNTMAIYYYRWVQNYQIMGILPTLSSLPKSAIIGAVTVDKWVTDSESEWAHPSSEHWLIKDAKLFKQPILGVKGKLGIFDYPAITEDNLPECVEIPRITRDGTYVTMPLAASKLEELRNDPENQISRSTSISLMTSATYSWKMINYAKSNPSLFWLMAIKLKPLW